MNAPAAAAPKHFVYYPGNYRWSAEMMVIPSAAPYGGADAQVPMSGAQHCQRDYLTLAIDTIADWLEEKLK